MLILFTMTLAVLVLVWSHPERGRPFGQGAVGAVCLLFGAISMGLLAAGYAGDGASSVHAEDEVTPVHEGLDPPGQVDAEVAEESEMTETVADPPAEGAETSDPSLAHGEPGVDTVTEVRYLTPRPAWVESRPNLSGSTHQLAIESGLYYRKREADRALAEELQKAVNEYVDDYLGSGYASELVGCQIADSRSGDLRVFRLLLDGDALPITADTFDEQVQVSFGIMHQSHALVHLDQSVRDKLDQRWSEIKARSRLLQTGLGAGALLFLLGTLFGYFKLDTATRGYYTGRLQFGAAAVILSLIAASVLTAKWIPWM